MTRIYILVEGDDDKRFFDGPAMKSALERKYREVHIVKYSPMPIESLARFIEGIRANEAMYVFVHDYDHGECMPSRKQEILQYYHQLNLDAERVLVVVHEIESWYYAGINERFCNRCGLAKLSSTEGLSKSGFNALIEGKFGSRIACLIDMVRNFSIQVATRKNESFAYFCGKVL